MFSQISWASYAQTILLLLLAYYVLVVYKYYRHDLIQILKGKKNLETNMPAFVALHQSENQQEVGDDNKYKPLSESNNNYYPLVQSLTDELQAFISEAGNNNFTKGQIIEAIRFLLRKYSSVQSSPYKESIQNLIVQECETNCSVHLSEDEADGLWV